MLNIRDVYENYYLYLYRYALKLTCHPDDALDLTQTAFLRAMEKLDTLKSERALASWLRTICFHEFLNSAKANPQKYLVEVNDWEQLEQEGRLLPDLQPLPEDEVIVAEEIRDLQSGCFLAMVRKLTLQQRIAFSLVDMYGLPVSEVANLLDVSVGAAKGLLYRARMSLDAFFAGHCSILAEQNPCSCAAWIEFAAKRDNLHQNAHRLLEQLNGLREGYAYDESVRRKVLSLYRNMPERTPPAEWYGSVLAALTPVPQ